MERLPYPYPSHAPKSTFAAKAVTAVFSVLTVSLLVFAGSRDWKSDRSWMAAMTDISDIRTLVANLSSGATRVKEMTAPAATTAEPEEKTSLISTGFLQHQKKGGTPMQVTGMEKVTAY